MTKTAGLIPVIAFLSLFSGLGNAWGNDLRVGVFEVDVSPPLGSPMAYDPCQKVAMPLTASGIVLLSDEEPVVLCSVDWIGIANAAHDEWRRRIAVAVGTSADRVSVHTVHQHDAPFCDFTAEAIMASYGLSGRLFDVKFAQESIAAVALAAARARQNSRRVTDVGVGEAIVERIASNRRILGADGKVRATRYTACTDPELQAEPEGTVDPKLKSISFWNADEPIAVLTYFATHPQSYYLKGIANPDFPGMARYLRQVTLNGVPHIHFNGAGGNIGAGKYNDGSPANRQALAVRLADAMANAYLATKRSPIHAGDLHWRTESIPLPAATHLNAQALEAIVKDPARKMQDRGAAAADLAWLRRTESEPNRQAPPELSMRVGCLDLGTNLSIVHLPGEAVVEFQLFAQQQAPDRFVAVAAYGDYGTGYICLAEHYAQGGYESSPRASRVDERAEQILKDGILKVIGRSNGGN